MRKAIKRQGWSFKHIACSIAIPASIFSLSTVTAQTPTGDDQRWYGVVGTNTENVAAARVSRDVKRATLDLDVFNAFVAQPLWLNTGDGSFVEVGYATSVDDISYPEPAFYCVSYVASIDSYTFREEQNLKAVDGRNTELMLWWDNNLKKWNCQVDGQVIGRAANRGGPVRDSNPEAGIESNSPNHYSSNASLYGIEYATINQWVWRPWPSNYTYSELPAEFFWIYEPDLGATRLN